MKTDRKVWYVVEHIDYMPTNSGRRSKKFDDRTHREKWFTNKTSATRYAKEVRADHEEWLAKIVLNKAVFSHEKW